MNNYEWQEQAACQGHDPSTFFGLAGVAMTEQEAEAAKAICRRCPVRDQCLDYALKTNQDYGVWGGLSEGDRERVRRQRRAGRTTNATADERRAVASRLAAIGASPKQVAEELGVSKRQAQRLVHTYTREAVAV